MLEYLQPLINYIHQHPHIGALIAFAVAMAESLPLIGTIIPGSITMTAIGTLVGAGILPGYSTLAWASLGAFTGDSIGFWVGYKFTDKIPQLWPFKKYPHWLEKSESFFQKHGGKSIIFGRFVGPARSTVPMVAGLLGMRWLRFVLAAIPSAILWAILYMVPGILLGALALELPPHIATEFVLIGLLVIVAIWLMFWALQYFFSQLAHIINVFVDNLWDQLIRHKPSRGFIRLIAVKGKPTDHYQLTLTLLCLLSLIFFFVLFYSVILHGSLTALNQPAFYFLQSLRSPKVETFFIVITLLGKPFCMMAISGLISLGLACYRQWRPAMHLVALEFFTAASLWLIKYYFHSPRPTGFQYVKTSSSFPSGHVTMSVITLGFLAYLSGKFCCADKKSLRWIPYTSAVVLILLIAISRLYLGAHWLTDIFGAFLMGLTLLFAVIVNYRRRAQKRFEKNTPTRRWFTIMTLGILIPWIFWLVHSYQQQKFDVQYVWPKIKMSYQQWWNKPLSYLPTYRLNRFGQAIQPFNIQWAGNLKRITKLLTTHRWAAIEPANNKKSQYHLPLLSWLYRHEKPSMVFIKKLAHNKQTIELRLWNSQAKFANHQSKLWIGTINFYIPPHRFFAIHYFHKEISLQENAGLKVLIKDLKRRYQFKVIHVPSKTQPSRVQALDWSGNVVILRKATT